MKIAFGIGIVGAIAALAVGSYMIDINQTEEASFPDVDVSVEGGNLPEYEAEVGEINVGTEEVTMEIPTVEIEAPGETSQSDS
ncbi:hypothetical protein [uncultured Sulfitobacter sp.]|uniref:hypothetical protein n=1 Tax=uncultured Sulfitobacter sp. TaxID=191468 RepID=UPI00261E410A|nr:hypothetical protein [uncultured Sulfitobacter sp.]